MVILFVWDARKNMMEMGRGGAYVPACVALQGRIHRSIPRAQCVCLGYGNAAARTFGRAHRHRPYAFCLEDCAWMFAPTVSFGQIVCGTVGFIGRIVRGWVVSFGWIAHECMIERRKSVCNGLHVAATFR